MKPELVKALRLTLRTTNTFQASRRPMDRLYGPQAKQLRHAIVEAIFGRSVPKSDKAIGWTNFHALLAQEVGATGDCIAALTHDTDEKIRAVLAG